MPEVSISLLVHEIVSDHTIQSYVHDEYRNVDTTLQKPSNRCYIISLTISYQYSEGNKLISDK